MAKIEDDGIIDNKQCLQYKEKTDTHEFILCGSAIYQNQPKTGKDTKGNSSKTRLQTQYLKITVKSDLTAPHWICAYKDKRELADGTHLDSYVVLYYPTYYTTKNLNWTTENGKVIQISGSNSETTPMETFDYVNVISGINTKSSYGAYGYFDVTNVLGLDDKKYVKPEDTNRTYFGSENAYIYNLKIFENETQAKEYLNTGSEDGLQGMDSIPDDYKEPSEEENPENNEDGTGAGEKLPTTPNGTPTTTPTGIKGGNNYYAMTPTNLESFVNYFWNDMLTDLDDIILNSLTKLYNNLNACVLSCRLYPFDVFSHLGQPISFTNILLGRFTTDVSAYRCDNYNPLINLGSIKVTQKFNNFLDYPPYTKVLIYLPYIGVRELDLNICMNRTITIQYLCDITTGGCDALIFCGGALIDSYQGVIGTDIPLNTDSAYQFASNITSSIISAGLSTVSGKGGNILGVAGEIKDSFSDTVSYNAGSPTPSNGLFYPQQCHLIYQRPTYNRPSTYGKNVGFPCMSTFKLDDLDGYTEVLNPYITYDKSSIKPTNKEQEDIKTLLEKGVYI